MPLLDYYLGSDAFPTSGGVLNQLSGGGLQVPHADWVRARQPYHDRHGRPCVTLTDRGGGFTRNDSHGGEAKPLLRNYLVQDLLNRGVQLPPVCNAASMPKGAWIEMDEMIVRAARQELRAAADLEASSSYGGFNAMAKMTLEYQAMSDPGEAFVDMHGTTDGRNDTPQFIIRSVPLPITHSDFGFSERELLVSQSGGMPFDSVMGEAAARRVGESIEDQVIGNVTGITYATQSAGYGAHTGTSTVYGYTTFPQRLTKSNFTAPTAGGWVPDTTYNEVLASVQQLLAQYFRGPFMLYHSLDWNQYMNRVYSVVSGNQPGETLRTMLLKIPQIQSVKLLERLTSTFTFLFVQMSPQVAQMIAGMDIAVLQWQEKGGLELRFKVMAIKVPRLRSDYNSRTGILHGTTA